MILGAEIMIPGGCRGIAILIIGNAGSPAVTYHFSHIAQRHTVSVDKSSGLIGIVNPVLKMMPVSALMMKPGH